MTIDAAQSSNQLPSQQATPSFYSVVVNLNGGRARTSNMNIRTTRLTTGEYVVTFPEEIDQWSWLASLGAVDDSNQVAGAITTQLGAMGVRTDVQVKTFNTGGNGATAADRPFHLYVRRLNA